MMTFLQFSLSTVRKTFFSIGSVRPVIKQTYVMLHIDSNLPPENKKKKKLDRFIWKPSRVSRGWG